MKKHIFSYRVELHHLSTKVTKYAMLNTKTLCDEGVFSSPCSFGFYGNGLHLKSPECYLFVMFADANVACIYEMTPCFQKTNILNMFTENCLLYIHINIYLFIVNVLCTIKIYSLLLFVCVISLTVAAFFKTSLQTLDCNC